MQIGRSSALRVAQVPGSDTAISTHCFQGEKRIQGEFILTLCLLSARGTDCLCIQNCSLNLHASEMKSNKPIIKKISWNLKAWYCLDYDFTLSRFLFFRVRFMAYLFH